MVNAGDVRIEDLAIATPDGPRHALMAVPNGPVMARRPVVLLFHGHGGSAKNALGQGLGPGSPLAAWLPIVARENLTVVALDGARGADGRAGWNDGRPGATGNPATDDVAFTRATLEQVRALRAYDPARVYAMGMSNGGVFVLRLARELSPPLAAVAACCASQPGEHAPASPPAAVSVLLVEGTADPLMPYAGGPVRFRGGTRGSVLGTDATVAYWRAADSLARAAPVTQAVPHRERRDPTRATRTTWGSDAGPQVRLVRIEGGGHCEPSRDHRYGLLYGSMAGAQNHDLESAEEAWAFFRDKTAR